MANEQAPDWKVRGWKVRVIQIHNCVRKKWKAGSDEDIRFLALALAGEVGELCNLIKKEWRGDLIPHMDAKLKEEIADVRIFLELLSWALGISCDFEAERITNSKLRKRWPAAYAGVNENE